MKPSRLIALLMGLAPLFAAALPTADAASEPAPIATLHAELDHATLRADGHGTAVLKVGLLPARLPSRPDRPPINLAIVLDRSGSMSGAKIEMAKRAAARAFDALGPDDRVAIVSYANNVHTHLPLTRVSRVGDPYRYIDPIRSGGGTAIYAGVNQAADELRHHRRDAFAIDRVLLLSDGLANQGPSHPEDFAQLGRALAREGVTVSTIGLGLDYNEDLMAKLAASSEGNVYFVESARDLPRIFESELGDTTSLVAHEATIEIRCLNGFQPLRVIGRHGSIQGDRVTVEIANLYAGREKYVLVELRNPGGEPNASTAVAAVETRIRDLATGRPVTLAQTAYADFTHAPAAYHASVNLEVQRELVANKIALVQEEAIELADAGKLDQATAAMADLTVWIAENNAEWGDEQIAESAARLEQTQKELETKGLDKRARKEMRASSYQTRSQQSYAK